MAYKIPKNLTKYSEQFLWGFSFKQFGYITATVLGILFIFMKLQLLLPVKILLSIPVFAIGLLFVYGKIDEKYMSDQNYRKSLKNTGYYDHKIDSFIAIKEVNDDTVFLKTGKMLAILQVTPINFAILSEEDQDYVLDMYRNWLKSLDFEVQITCRSIDLDLDGWLSSLEKKDKVKQDKERFNSFKKWINKFVEEKNVRNRVFYISVPIRPVAEARRSFWEILRGMLISTPASSESSKAYQQSLKELNDRVKSTIELLKPTGVGVKRMTNNELLGLYSSYFTNMPGGGKSYLTPVMWPNKNMEAKLK